MELKEYIKKILESFEGNIVFEFNLGIDENLEVNPKSENRIKFKFNYYGK